MKKGLLFLAVIFLSAPLFAQLLSWSPNFPTETSGSFEITMDGSKGNQALNFYTPTTDV